ncbi:MAG: glycosyltransferase family 4 protein [Gammaproteobacteria bacterium]
MTASLHILLVLESAGGGAARHVLDLARGLLALGHVVHLAWSPLRAEPQFPAALGMPGLTTHAVPMTRGPGLRDVTAVRAVRVLLRHQRFDIIHGHSSKAGALARLAALGSGVTAVYTPHALVTFDPSLGRAARAAYGLAERMLAGLGARVICVSVEERAHALTLGIPPSRLAVVPNGIGPLALADRTGARLALGIPDAAVCVGFVGRLSAQKAVLRLVDAFALACPSGASDARLALVGDGPERVALQHRAEALGIADRVVFAGHGDGPALMAGFDVFVLPSRYEGFPYVLLEAGQRSLPIITTAVGGASTVVHPGENGCILDATAPVTESLADALRKLVADRTGREEMGRRSAGIVATLTVEAMVRQTVEVYRDALGSQAGRAPPGTVRDQ